MHHVASIEIALGATGPNVRVIREKVWATVVAAWNGLQHLASAPDTRRSGAKPRPLPGYYGTAYDAANTGAPVATFRGLV